MIMMNVGTSNNSQKMKNKMRSTAAKTPTATASKPRTVIRYALGW